MVVDCGEVRLSSTARRPAATSAARLRPTIFASWLATCLSWWGERDVSEGEDAGHRLTVGQHPLVLVDGQTLIVGDIESGGRDVELGGVGHASGGDEHTRRR
jgi:hypothetical protein